jgi:hypothetical protein
MNLNSISSINNNNNKCPSLYIKCNSLQIACSLGHLNCVKILVLLENRVIDTHSIVYALDENNFDCAIFCLQNRDKSVELYPSLSQIIILKNNIDLLKAAVENEIPFSSTDLMLLLEYNNLETFKFMQSAGYNFSKLKNIKNPRLNRYNDRYDDFTIEDCLSIAIQNKLDVEIIELLFNDGVLMSDDVLELSCYYDNFNIFKYLLSRGLKCRNINHLIKNETFDYLECYLQYCLHSNYNVIQNTPIKALVKLMVNMNANLDKLDLMNQIGIRKLIKDLIYISVINNEEFSNFVKKMDEFKEEIKKLTEVLKNVTGVCQDVIKYEMIKYI